MALLEGCESRAGGNRAAIIKHIWRVFSVPKGYIEIQDWFSLLILRGILPPGKSQAERRGVA